MKKVIGKVSALLLMLLSVMLAWGSSAYAKSQDMTIPDGVYMEDMNLSGMTQEEAMQMVNDFVAGLKQKVVTFGAVGDHYVAVTAGDLGMTWVNTAAIEEAAGLGKAGNIVQRYKAIQDLKHGNKVYKLELGFDKDLIRNILQEQCAEYDVQAENAQLTRQDGSFQVVEGQTGEAVNVEESLNQIYEYLTNGWDYQDASIDLVIDTTQPKGNAEDLAKVKDVLGTYTTSYSTSGSARCKNVENGCRLINGTTLYPGEEFSTLDKISPFTEANGYYPAGSYLNGMVVDSLGGGICQVSTTLYNAVIRAELEIVTRAAHSMIVSYVEPSMDAAIGGEAHALSGGEERRLDLARTLWRQGSLVMLDEPTAGLDEKTRVELEKQIAQLPCDILIVAMHNYSPEFLDSFTKVLRIRDGELEP